MAESWDYSDAAEQRGDEAVRETIDGAALDQPAKLLPFIDAGDWEGVQPLPREWMLEGWEPKGSATYLTGIGASGKSLLTQQRLTCAAARLPFLGLGTTPGVSIYITCEDTMDELHRRQDAINAALGIGWEKVRGRLILVSLKGMQNNELCTFDGAGRMSTTPRWAEVLATIRAVGATHVGLDNVAHFFAGNENIRNHVAAFTGLLDRLAGDIDGGVLLLGHPNKAGDEFSGSTAWENQVRSRIYLSLPEPDANGVADPDARRLSNSKPNYSRRGETVDFVWYKWAFVRSNDLPPDVAAENSKNAQAAVENARFLECLDKTAEEKRATSLAPSASSYAPRVFAKMPTARGMTAEAFERAMQRLFHLGIIKGDQPVYKRDNRVWVKGLGRAPTPAPTPHEAVHEACTNPHENPHQPAPARAPSTYGTNGAATQAAAPTSIEDDETAERAEPAGPSWRPGVPILAPGESADDPIPGWDS